MSAKLLRLVYVVEYLIAVIAIFTAWSEIGGQAALDLMNWGFKLGLGLLLAWLIVGYTAALVSSDAIWTLQTIRWLTCIILVILAMGVITYFYFVAVEAGESDETGMVSIARPNAAVMADDGIFDA